MPYHWTESPGAPGTQRLELWPYRSLPLKGFAVVIMTAFLFITIPLFGLLGTVLLWGILPFVLLAIAGLWWGLRRSYHDGTLTETLDIGPDMTELLRREPNGREQSWSCNSYWVRVTQHKTGGPVPFYVTLSGKGREVEIGAFLSEDERKSLYDDLQRRLTAVLSSPHR